MLSNGTPMFVAGDEFLATHKGNNNPYNQVTTKSTISIGICSNRTRTSSVFSS